MTIKDFFDFVTNHGINTSARITVMVEGEDSDTLIEEVGEIEFRITKTDSYIVMSK